MVHSVCSKSLSQHQMSLLERALLVLAKMDETGWQDMPLDLRISFAKYMHEEVWTHLPDLMTLREAALLIVRDAIAHAGEFNSEPAGQSPAPPKALAAK